MDTQGIERQLGSIMEKLDRQEQLLEEIRYHHTEGGRKRE